MLYRVADRTEGGFTVEPMPFLDLSALGKLEKDLEDLLAEHLLGTLFEDAALMPIFQERSLQAEEDLYALDQKGDLYIFELKRGLAGAEAMEQALRYSQTAGQWSFKTLEEKYNVYLGSPPDALRELFEAHRDAFELEHPLSPSEFNRRQHLYVVGNAANDELIRAVEYWKNSGLSVEFVPYRLYEVGGDHYFEFFALPYDRHVNPASIKGVIFDTNRAWDEEAIWEMMEKNRVAAYGDIRRAVEYLNPRDIVFFSHKWTGIVAAAEVTGPVRSVPEAEEQYRSVRFLTSVPSRGEPIRAMSFSEVSRVTGKGFFWAKTVKVPYLNADEARRLVAELQGYLSAGP